MGSFWLVLAAVVVVIALLLVAVAKAGKSGGSAGLPYRLAKTLFTPAERAFLGVLDQAVGPEFRVFGKVRVGDIAVPKSGLSNSQRTTARNRVEKKHFDFVICRASDLVPVCAVELNDKTHGRKDRQDRDEFVAGVCEAIGLPLLQPRAAGGYVVADLRAQFRDRIQPATDRASAAASL